MRGSRVYMAGVGGGRMWNGYALNTIFFQDIIKNVKTNKIAFPCVPCTTRIWLNYLISVACTEFTICILDIKSILLICKWRITLGKGHLKCLCWHTPLGVTGDLPLHLHIFLAMFSTLSLPLPKSFFDLPFICYRSFFLKVTMLENPGGQQSLELQGESKQSSIKDSHHNEENKIKIKCKTFKCLFLKYDLTQSTCLLFFLKHTSGAPMVFNSFKYSAQSFITCVLYVSNSQKVSI